MTEAPRTVGEFMHADPITVRQDASLQEAVAILDQYRIHGLPVVDASGLLVGVLSQTDLVRARATEHMWARWPGLAVKHLMTSPAVTCRPDCPVEEAVRMMEIKHIHRLVVVDESGTKPVGVFSTSDVIRALAGA
jgi:CBS domain-containing protein